MPNDLSGIWAPICTPFVNEELDIENFKKNIELYAKTPLRGYFVLGSNGEACMLNEKEKLKLLSVTAENKHEGKLVMAGCNHESARNTIAFTKLAHSEGADVASVITPHYFKKEMNDKALINFYQAVADSSPLPILLYNAPGFAGGVQLSIEAVATLSRHPNIVGMKDSAPTGPNNFLAYADVQHFSILAGSANFILPSLVMGAAGGVLSLANLFPNLCHQLYELFKKNDLENARKLQRAILKANQSISGKFGVAGVKAGMDYIGFYGGNPRLPLMPLTSEERNQVQVAINKLLQEYPTFIPAAKNSKDA